MSEGKKEYKYEMDKKIELQELGQNLLARAAAGNAAFKLAGIATILILVYCAIMTIFPEKWLLTSIVAIILGIILLKRSGPLVKYELRRLTPKNYS